MKRSAPTISREVKRSAGSAPGYDAVSAALACRARRRRGPVKLREGTALRQHVLGQIRLAWSPQQISGRLRAMNDPALPVVSHETIYRAIYVIARGELRKELIGFLRQAHKTRGARGRGANRQGRLPDMVSVHDRPEEALARLLPGDWEGDFVKGAGNASAIGTLVERKSRYTLIAKMKDCGAQAALDGFTKAFAKVPQMMRRSLAYDQGKEMARHKELASRLNMRVYFCDPHSPWQRPTNENLNGLVRQYLPKGIDLSINSQKDLDRIAHSLNTRPRAVLGFQTPMEVFNAELSKIGDALQSRERPIIRADISQIRSLTVILIEKNMTDHAFWEVVAVILDGSESGLTFTDVIEGTSPFCFGYLRLHVISKRKRLAVKQKKLLRLCREGEALCSL